MIVIEEAPQTTRCGVPAKGSQFARKIRAACSPSSMWNGHAAAVKQIIVVAAALLGGLLTTVSDRVLPLAAANALLPELIELAPRDFIYRPAGEFTRNGKPAAAPLFAARLPRPLVIMKRQVTATEYRRCVAAGHCPSADRGDAAPDRPAVLVSWWDAQSYAAWLSRRTGESFRLPTDEEWVYSAGARFRDNALAEVDQADPGRRALARYQREAEDDEVENLPQPVGSFGANENGLLDIAGNVWEWTDSCFVRTALDDGRPTGDRANCGIRVVEGRHRTYLTDFVRDARAGGCAVGKPPSNLGFRLVRDSSK
jgi:formylglycine-generating enzyme required for sulfatase activity